tara:strand:+ start:187 stop:1455 length:1269 start_codon:yes stop_codon:yes gene_type:complete
MVEIEGKGFVMPDAPAKFSGGLKSDWKGTEIIYVEGEGYKVIIDLGNYSYALDLPDDLTLKDISNYYDNRTEPKITDKEERAARQSQGITVMSEDQFDAGFLNGDKLVSVPASILSIEGDAVQIANNFLDAVEQNQTQVTSTLLNDDEYVNNLASYYIASGGDMGTAITNFKKTDKYGSILDRLNVTQAQIDSERAEFTDPEQFDKDLITYTDLYNRTAVAQYGSEIPKTALNYLADQTRRGYFTQQEAITQIQGVFDPAAGITMDIGLINALEGQSIKTTTAKETEVQDLLDMYIPKHLQGEFTVSEEAGKMRNNSLYKDIFINKLKDTRFQFYGQYDRDIAWQTIVNAKKENASAIMGVNLKNDDPLLDQLITTNDYAKETELMRQVGLDRGYQKVKNDLTNAMMDTFGSGVVTSRSYVG